jgi:hypothetical protein
MQAGSAGRHYDARGVSAPANAAFHAVTIAGLKA